MDRRRPRPGPTVGAVGPHRAHLSGATPVRRGGSRGSRLLACWACSYVEKSEKAENSSEAIVVQSIKVDELVKENVVLMKIDVEGFETEVLNGMQNTLEDYELKGVVIELNGSGNRYGYDEKRIHQKLLGLGFNAYQYDPFERQLKLVTDFGKHNTIYLRDPDFIKKRISVAEKITVFSESF